MSKNLTTEEFIKRAQQVHNNKYNYSQTKYVCSREKITIICMIHGLFIQEPYSHLKGCGCSKCGRKIIDSKRTLSFENFIKLSKSIHGDKFTYINPIKIGYRCKIDINCKLHGIFNQLISNHLRGSGCPKCSKFSYLAKKHLLNSKNFIKKANKKHNNKYDYSLTNYLGNRYKIIIICKKHNTFEQLPSNHLKGSGCPKCFGLHKTTDDFLKECLLKHGKLYDYSLVKYTSHDCMIKIICKKHGIFEQCASQHRNGNNCPNCRLSKGEIEIFNLLKLLNINYKQNKKFLNCRNTRPLSFDFYLYDYNTCIEYDGIQHFIHNELWHDKIKWFKSIENDNIKNKFCKENNIKLIRIPYIKFNQIKEILQNEYQNGFNRSLDLSEELHNKIKSNVIISNG